MSISERRTFLLCERLQVQHFLTQVADDPLMAPQFESRLKSIQSELESLKGGGKEAKITLYFAGRPVLGSQAIEAEFLSEVLAPFLEIVKSQYAASKHGKIGERGPRRDEDESRLLLTGTPRGSFGIELSAPPTEDLFAEERLATVLAQVSRLIEGAVKSDTDYLRSLDDIHERAFQRLPSLFEILSKAGATLRVSTGDIEFSAVTQEIQVALERVNKSTKSDEVNDIEGVYRGALLDKWRFDFRPDRADTISGRLASDILEDDVAGWFELVNKPALATIKTITRTAPGGSMRRSYELLNLRQP